MRLDKFLSCTAHLTRSEAKQMLKKGVVTVNGVVIKSGDTKVAEASDHVTLCGEPLSYAEFHYYLLNKPAGYVTATEDKRERTVLDLLDGIDTKELFPVGRLDKDTEGLLLITDDGALAHKLLSPKKHVDKTYYVKLTAPLSLDSVKKLEAGVDIGDDTPTLPAKVQQLSGQEILLTIHEGRFHQIKRMAVAVGNEVCYLKRLSMGTLSLPPELAPGAFRELTEEEIAGLKQENAE